MKKQFEHLETGCYSHLVPTLEPTLPTKLQDHQLEDPWTLDRLGMSGQPGPYKPCESTGASTKKWWNQS